MPQSHSVHSELFASPKNASVHSAYVLIGVDARSDFPIDLDVSIQSYGIRDYFRHTTQMSVQQLREFGSRCLQVADNADNLLKQYNDQLEIEVAESRNPARHQLGLPSPQ